MSQNPRLTNNQTTIKTSLEELLTTTQGNRSTTNIYNDKDDLITTVDTEGVPTHYTYDEMHRVTEISRAGQVVQYTYDSNGNLESTTTPNKATFSLAPTLHVGAHLKPNINK